MSIPLTILSVVGARPQFVKLAPIARALQDLDGVAHRIVHTGQHYDDNMSARFFEEFNLPEPDTDLGVGSGSHAAQTADMLTKLELTLEQERADVVLVYGDTNSTLAATLAAAKLHVPVAHIEAGLRSFNRHMPEEINRLVADHCSDRLYAPTPRAMRNLVDENLASRSIVTGDVMRDAVIHNLELARKKSTALESLDLDPGEFGLVTVHRPVNTETEALAQLMHALDAAAVQHLPMVFPVHPRTRAALDSISFSASSSLRMIEPLAHIDTIALIESAAFVITDSGGVQKEAAFLRTPCLTARNETEWIETVDIGVNRLVGDAPADLRGAVADVLDSGDVFGADRLRDIDTHFGVGDAAQRIVTDCIEWIS